MSIQIAPSTDLPAVREVERLAFGPEQAPEIVAFVEALLNDPTAEPRLSLLAHKNDRPVGHILFTHARISTSDEAPSAAILAPLAVIPEFQSQGIGGRLIQDGSRRLWESGVDLVFVLGNPGYYPCYGFQPAGVHGLDAPYPILEKNADAWMVRALWPGVLGNVKGSVICADALDRPEYWRE
ncbi:MAG: GNAT family N-acetyltransferase [Desulfococcaceae bacterium]